jgi:hypothetical protein
MRGLFLSTLESGSCDQNHIFHIAVPVIHIAAFEKSCDAEARAGNRGFEPGNNPEMTVKTRVADGL